MRNASGAIKHNLMYKRVLLKLSGESLGGQTGKGLDTDSLRAYAHEIADAAKAGLEIKKNFKPAMTKQEYIDTWCNM